MSGAQFIFYVFSVTLIGAAVMVIMSRNPVKCALFLVLAFVASAVLWMLLQAEFLALVLIFVYVGAVMTLFLFVVMMINIDMVPRREKFVRYLPFGILVMLLLVGLMIYVINPKHFAFIGTAQIIQHGVDYSNVKALGQVLYTKYMYPFELAAVLLLVAIVSAISLAFRGPKNRKTQDIAKQHATKAERQMRLVDIKPE